MDAPQARSARDRAKEARRLEEDMLLKQMSAALEAERQVAAAKKAAALEEMSKTMQENEVSVPIVLN